MKRYELSEMRKQLHQIPEPAFQENKTKHLILFYLQGLSGITIHQLKNSPGLLIEYSHGRGSYQLFRADMDGLPVTENTGCEFASQHHGMMHACGHDVHMTVLLGLIREVTVTNPAKNLLFLFQPAEEGMGGAESVLTEGLLQQFDISAVYALHVSGSLPVNTISSKAGIFFAIPQEFDVVFTGSSAHAAFPEKGKNALKAGLDFCNQMQEFIYSHSQEEKLIFNIGAFNSGIIRNIIPDSCILQGTHRSLSKQMRDLINTELRETASRVARKYELSAEVKLLCTYDPVINDINLVGKLKETCENLELDYRESEVFMTGEDFGFFTSRYPGLLFWLGGGELAYDLHSAKFLPDDSCIQVGINIFLKLMETDS